VRSLEQLRRVSGEQTGFIFRAYQHDTAPLSKMSVTHRLRKALAAAGVKGEGAYASHSLKRGGATATHAEQSGESTRMAQLLGRWKSDAVRQYMYASERQAIGASARMLQSS